MADNVNSNRPMPQTVPQQVVTPGNAMPGGMDPMQQQKAQLLAQMNDIKTPPEVDWWPPAIGWWIVMLLTLVALGSLIWTVYRKWRNNRYRQQALRRIDDIQHAATEYNVSETVQLTLKTLKQTFFTAYPAARRTAAGVYGDAFLSLLDATCSKPTRFRQLAAFCESALYKPPHDIDYHQQSQLLIAARQWIKHHKTLNTETFSQLVNRYHQPTSATPSRPVTQTPSAITTEGVRYASV